MFKSGFKTSQYGYNSSTGTFQNSRLFENFLNSTITLEKNHNLHQEPSVPPLICPNKAASDNTDAILTDSDTFRVTADASPSSRQDVTMTTGQEKGKIPSTYSAGTRSAADGDSRDTDNRAATLD